jgi:hypothetical protein
MWKPENVDHSSDECYFQTAYYISMIRQIWAEVNFTWQFFEAKCFKTNG